MALPPGRPPDNLIARLRSWYLSSTTSDVDRGFLAGQLAAWDTELQERNGHPAPRRRAKPEAGEVPLIEGQ